MLEPNTTTADGRTYTEKRKAYDLGYNDAKQQFRDPRNQGTFSSGRTWDDEELNDAYDRGVNQAEKENDAGRISIKIGRSDTLEYYITDTSAPLDYDGFGTITAGDFALGLHEEGRPYRVVLIAADHYVWQTSRYSSGNHWSRPSVFDADAIQEILWKRIAAKPEV